MADDTQVTIGKLRVVVGYLGEKAQHNWWGCSFFSPVSSAYLDPVFPRTAFLARCHGVKAAATRLHDDRIGVGRVYHLFRLPEYMEQRLHNLYLDTEIVPGLQELVESADAAQTALEGMASGTGDGGEGPMHCGDRDALGTPAAWAQVAALYCRAFRRGYRAFPYFTDSR